MTEPVAPDPVEPAEPAIPVDAVAAGALLREARERQGLHIGALATAIKVSPAKLEALEAGRVEDLPDTTFARALAKAVCRTLGIDAAPVLSRMPGAPPSRLERVDEGLNAPFRERPGRVEPVDWAPWRHPVPWLVAVLLAAAAAFVLVPRRAPEVDSGLGPNPSAVPAASAVASVARVSSRAGNLAADVASTVASAAATLARPASVPLPVVPATLGTPAASAAVVAVASAPAAGKPALAEALSLHARQASWVQVVDANGQTLARVISAGETVAFTGRPPLKLKIGNARGVELSYRGRPVDLAPSTRDNVANLWLP